MGSREPTPIIFQQMHFFSINEHAHAHLHEHEADGFLHIVWAPKAPSQGREVFDLGSVWKGPKALKCNAELR